MRRFAFIFALLAFALISPRGMAAEEQQPGLAVSQSNLETWMTQRLKADGRLDFHDKCRLEMNSANDQCRTVDAALVSKALRNPDISREIRISGAIVAGTLDLSETTFHQALTFEDVVFLMEVQINDSSFEKDVIFANDRLHGGLKAGNTEFSSRLIINTSTAFHPVDISDAIIRRGLFITNSQYDRNSSLYLNNASVLGELQISGTTFASEFNAKAAIISRVAHVSNSSFNRGLIASWAHFKSVVIDRGTSFDGSMSLEGAHVDDDVVIKDSQFRSPACNDDEKSTYSADWERIDVKGSVFITDGTSFECAFDMIESSVEGNVEIGNSKEARNVVFTKQFNLSLSTIKNSVYVHDVQFQAEASISSTQIARHLDVAGSTFNVLNLSRTSIGDDFRLWPQGKQAYHTPLAWKGENTKLDIHYAHVGVIQDEIVSDNGSCGGTEQAHRWPRELDVEGFTFDRFGTPRNADWVDCWLKKWPGRSKAHFDPQPFDEMANYFRRVGAQDDSDQIKTTSRDLELNSYKQQCSSDMGACWHFVRLGFLKLFVGYGIGWGIFWVLLPTIAFVLVGCLVLQFSEAAKGEGLVWCGILSLNKLIPGINFSKEFAEAFDEPTKLNLNNPQKIYFFVHTIVGFVLALVIGAALTGLTQAR